MRGPAQDGRQATDSAAAWRGRHWSRLPTRLSRT